MGVFHFFKLHKWYQIAQSISVISSFPVLVMGARFRNGTIGVWPQDCNFIKKRLRHRSFAVNFGEFSRTRFSKKTFGSYFWRFCLILINRFLFRFSSFARRKKLTPTFFCFFKGLFPQFTATKNLIFSKKNKTYIERSRTYWAILFPHCRQNNKCVLDSKEETKEKKGITC